MVKVIVKGKIPFWIMHKPESLRGHFKEEVSNSEIEKSVDVHSFIFYRQVFENDTVWHIYKDVTNSPVIPEEMAIIAVIPVMVMDEKYWSVAKFTNYMSKSGMVIVMFMKPEGIGMVTGVIVSPAIQVPAVSLPSVIPVLVFPVIVMAVIFFVVSAVMFASGCYPPAPVFFASSVIFAGFVAFIVLFKSVNLPVS